MSDFVKTYDIVDAPGAQSGKQAVLNNEANVDALIAHYNGFKNTHKHDGNDDSPALSAYAAATHTHGGDPAWLTLFANEAALTNGSTDGEVAYIINNGNSYNWDDTNSMWRIKPNNVYPSLPSNATYTIPDGTPVVLTSEDGNIYTWDYSNLKWRVMPGNIYAADPSTTTYTVEVGTLIVVNEVLRKYASTGFENAVTAPIRFLWKKGLKVYTPQDETATGDTTNASTTVSNTDTSSVGVGWGVSGTGIPSGATIASITDATTFELSAAATADGTAVSLTFSTANHVRITADAIIIRDSAESADILAESVDVHAGLNVSGVGGLDTGSEANSSMYYVWLINNGTTTAGLLSLSATAPTMPTGYSYKRLIGEIYNDSSGDVEKSYRVNDDVEFEDPQEVFTNQSLTTSFVQHNLPSTVPSGAAFLIFEASNVGAFPALQVISPDNTTRFETTVSNAASTSGNAGPTSGYASLKCRMFHLGATSIYVRANDSATRTGQNLHIWGYSKEV